MRKEAAAARCELGKTSRLLAIESPASPLLKPSLQEFRAALLEWFARFQRDLPWRGTKDPYRIWISEIMLQQTRVAAVIPYYERFLERFPNVQALALAPEEEVLRMWSGLGYYSRARNLHAGARQIMEGHKGDFPRTKGEALELAGIGEYTAPAILSIAFGEKLAVLDGNVARVIARLDAVRGDLRAPRRWRALQERADQLLAVEAAGDWNQGMMELGAMVCTPQAPQCLLCPVRQFCKARKLGVAEKIPERRKKRAEVAIRLAVAVLLDKNGRSLLLEPPTDANGTKADEDIPSLVAKLWHFPTAAAGGDGVKSLRQILQRELGLTSRKMSTIAPLQTVRHTVTYRKIEVAPYLVRVQELPKIRNARCMALDAIVTEPISNLTRKVARVAIDGLALEKGRTVR